MPKPDGGPAFPFDIKVGNHEYQYNKGMSLRDYFAGQIIQGMNASPELMQVITANGMASDGTLNATAFERMAIKAYQQADALIAKRSKPEPGSEPI